MYLYGGVYADLDVICLKPFEALIESERRARLDACPAGCTGADGHDAEPAAICPGRRGRLSALCVFLCKSVLYGAFVWARRALNGQNCRFPARAVGMMGTDFAFMHNMPNGAFAAPLPALLVF